MAILRSMDGRFYNVPDDQLGGFEVAPTDVKKQLGAAGGEPESANAGDVKPMGCWRNCWRNCWSRNCWRNCH